MNDCAGVGTERLLSLDVLRGYDMFFIMGGFELVCAVATLMGYPDFAARFDHVPWDGLQFMDTIFPLFLFLAGASFPLSCAKSESRGLGRRSIAIRSLRRGLILVLLGVLGGLLRCKFGTMRVWSVLGRIGLAWMVASWLYLLFGTRVRILLCVLVLVAVPLFFVLVPAPDALTLAYPESLKELEVFGRGPFSPVGNVGCWLDRTLTGGHTYRPLFDPEGFAGFLPSVVTALLGMFAGDIVRGSGGACAGKALRLLASGALCGILGLGASLVCPVNKALWSSSFVLVVGAYSFVLFAAFYWMIDVKQWRKWTLPLQVIGMNSITIYMAQQIIGFQKATNFFFGGFKRALPDEWGALVWSIGYLLVCWSFLYVLYRKKVFLKV